VACAASSARVGSLQTGGVLFERATNVALIQYDKISVQRIRGIGQVYRIDISNQISFKGKTLSSSVEIIAFDPNLLPDGHIYVPTKPSFALLFLRSRDDSRYNYVATDIEQVFIEPEISVALSSFRTLPELVVYLLRSSVAKNRRMGLLLAGNLESTDLNVELRRLAETGSDEERVLARKALQLK